MFYQRSFIPVLLCLTEAKKAQDDRYIRHIRSTTLSSMVLPVQLSEGANTSLISGSHQVTTKIHNYCHTIVKIINYSPNVDGSMNLVGGSPLTWPFVVAAMLA